MSILCVPPLDSPAWPTLGQQVGDWMEENLVFGPGDLKGRPCRLTQEQWGFLYRMYEVHPHGSARAGRRRFSRAAISIRKGLAKTEFAAWIAAAELHPEAPVRCVNWWKPRGGDWEPEGGPVNDPYIPMLATSEEQAETLAFGALLAILSDSGCRAGRDLDLGLEKILRLDGNGRAEALAGAPNSRDGARTTFQHFDETHRLKLPSQREAHQTMLANMPKRPLADPWALETTTAYAPGENSVAESTMDYGRKIAEGQLRDVRLFFFHRDASPEHDVTTKEGLRAAVLEASGRDAAKWSDIDWICAQWDDPSQDKTYLQRVWLNRTTGRANRAFDAERWKELSRPGEEIDPDRLVTLGFDGSLYHDSTGLVATDVEAGFQQVVAVWEHPGGNVAWKVPKAEVNAAMEYAFERWEVWRAYCDPPYWEEQIAQWQGRWGNKVVVEFATNRWKLMGMSLAAYHQAIVEGEVTNDGNETMYNHIGNAIRVYTHFKGADGEPLWILDKERPDSPFKIDLDICGCLSWQGRLDALSEGATASNGEINFY